MSTQEKIGNIAGQAGKVVGLMALVSAGSKRTTVGKQTRNEDAGVEEDVDGGPEKLKASADAITQSQNAGLIFPGIFEERSTEVYTLTGISSGLLLVSTVLKNIDFSNL